MSSTDSTATTAHLLTADRINEHEALFRPNCAACGPLSGGWLTRAHADKVMDEHEAATEAASTPAPRLPKADVIQLTAPTPEASRVAQVAAGLRDLAAWVEANEGLVADLYPGVDLLLCASGTGRDRIAAIARSGLATAGVRVTKTYSEKYAGAQIHFGRYVKVDVYAGRDEVCERVVVGTREVTEEVPDPEALAAVPTVSVTKTVEDVEWKCLPLLAVDGAR